MALAKKCCQSCGAAMVEYTHRLNAPLVKAIVTSYYYAQDREFRVKELGLDHGQQANYQKAQYWGFVAKTKGGWTVTPIGRAFVLGDKTMPKVAVTYRGKTIRLEGEEVSIYEIVENYSVREDYAAEARAHDQDAAQGQGSLL